MKSIIRSVSDFIKRTDIYLITLCIFASVFGLVMVMSATRYSLSEEERFQESF